MDLRAFWKHGDGHVLAVRQYNWLTGDAPSGAQATVTLRGYKQGQYLSPYMSSLEVEERWAFNERWGATLFGGAAERMLVSLEYAQGIGDSRGI